MMGVVLCYFAFRNHSKLKSSLNSNGLQILKRFKKRKPFLIFLLTLGQNLIAGPALPHIYFPMHSQIVACSASISRPNSDPTTLFTGRRPSRRMYSLAAKMSLHLTRLCAAPCPFPSSP
jgi:hypothetical protein